MNLHRIHQNGFRVKITLDRNLIFMLVTTLNLPSPMQHYVFTDHVLSATRQSLINSDIKDLHKLLL